MIKEITSVQHPLVKHLARLRHNSDYRHEHKSVLVEGIKLIHEVVNDKNVKNVLATCETLFPKHLKKSQCTLITHEVLKKISGLISPDGILAEVEMPAEADLAKKNFILAFDHVADPGNVGALLRTALALGWEGAFFIGDCCDPYNDKALRAARGATFRIPMAHGSWDDLSALVKKNKLTPFAADIEGAPLQKLEAPARALLVVGNEAHGLSPETKNLCSLLTIPMVGPMESLNVSIAGSIIMYHLKRGT